MASKKTYAGWLLDRVEHYTEITTRWRGTTFAKMCAYRHAYVALWELTQTKEEFMKFLLGQLCTHETQLNVTLRNPLFYKDERRAIVEAYQKMIAKLNESEVFK